MNKLRNRLKSLRRGLATSGLSMSIEVFASDSGAWGLEGEEEIRWDNPLRAMIFLKYHHAIHVEYLLNCPALPGVRNTAVPKRCPSGRGRGPFRETDGDFTCL